MQVVAWEDIVRCSPGACVVQLRNLEDAPQPTESLPEVGHRGWGGGGCFVGGAVHVGVRRLARLLPAAPGVVPPVHSARLPRRPPRSS